MARGRRILFGLWAVANAVVLALLVLNPQVTRSLCSGRWIDNPVDWIRSDDGAVPDLCGVQTSSLADRGVVVTAAIVGNGVALALWTTKGRTRSPASN